MSRPTQPRRNRGRRSPAKRGAHGDIWRTPPALPEIEPITVPPDASAVIRSLGPPPIPGDTDAGYRFVTVVERAAAIAAALALSAGLLEDER